MFLDFKLSTGGRVSIRSDQILAVEDCSGFVSMIVNYREEPINVIASYQQVLDALRASEENIKWRPVTD
jgi:hypothetical protein